MALDEHPPLLLRCGIKNFATGFEPFDDEAHMADLVCDYMRQYTRRNRVARLLESLDRRRCNVQAPRFQRHRHDCQPRGTSCAVATVGPHNPPCAGNAP